MKGVQYQATSLILWEWKKPSELCVMSIDKVIQKNALFADRFRIKRVLGSLSGYQDHGTGAKIFSTRLLPRRQMAQPSLRRPPAQTIFASRMRFWELLVSMRREKMVRGRGRERPRHVRNAPRMWREDGRYHHSSKSNARVFAIASTAALQGAQCQWSLNFGIMGQPVNERSQRPISS